MEQIKTQLNRLVYSPYNDTINFELGYLYENEKQYAAAVSYYLRSAEFTEDKVFASESLLRAALCINNQEGRDEKELYLIKHAINESPNSLEPYYIASLYFSWRKKWMDSYHYANLGINILKNKMQEKSFNKTLNYDDYQLYYQKAFSGTHIGKINEAREIYTKLMYNPNIPQGSKNFINSKLCELPEPCHPIQQYCNEKINTLKYNFNNCDSIIKNYSQIYQDMFVLSIHNGKNNGTYLEIGAGDYKNGNNTYLLESKFNWTGISIDINRSFVDNFNNNRTNICICEDATKIDYHKLLNDNLNMELSKNNKSKIIDYLQLDCDPPNITFDILKKIPFDSFKFGVITYEHDFYNDHTGSYREKSRDFLKSKGYKLLCGNISPYKDKYPFEDWWIHPDLIDENIWKLFKREDDKPINGEKYMFAKSKYIQTPIFEISDKLTIINNYHKNTSATFKLYKKCYICDCIRRGYRWEEHQHNIIDKYLDINSVAIEAGSHVGTLAVKLANTCKLTYCFEPIINTYDLLEFNMNINCNSSKYKLFNKGLGECIKTENIYWISPDSVCAIGLTNNIYEPLNNNEKNNVIEAGAKDIPIEIITIDSLNLDKLDYIKIDVEGYEENVINGGINTIKKYKPIIILECYETFSPLIPASIEFVKNKYQFIIDIGYKIEHVWCADFLFSPIEKKEHKDKTNSIKDLYDFIPCHDQVGNDLYRYNPTDLEKLLESAYNVPDCIAVNTHGYLKNSVDKIEQINNWYYPKDGIYIKKTNKLDRDRYKNMIPVLGTLVCTTCKWIIKQLDTIDYPIENYIIINNNYTLSRELETIVSKKHKFIKNLKVYTMPYNLGCAEGWNMIIKSFMFSPYWIISNDDVAFTPGFLEEMNTKAYNNINVGLIHGNPINLPYLNKFGAFDLFLIKDWVIQEYGLFDINYYPAYFEDFDYIMRLLDKPIEIINSLQHSYYHGDSFDYNKTGANTKNFNDLLNIKLTFAKYENLDYFAKKWNIYPEHINEESIKNCYKTPFNKNCSYKCTFDLEFCKSKHLLNSLWQNNNITAIDNINTNLNTHITNKYNANVIVIDNFYTNPDKIREYALSLTYQPPENHGAVGYRSESGRKILEGTKEFFEKLLHKSIPNGNNHGEWNYSTNGCFQWCNAQVPIVYHADSQQYAAILYLTPDAPPNCGTSFFRHKNYKIRNSEIFSKPDWHKSSLIYRELNLDKTLWEIVDSIGNVYNRLVIFDAQYIHAVTEYFGENINNSRLFQLFFFNVN